MAWWLEVRWSETGWLIEYSVRANHNGAEDIVKAFRARKAETLDAFITQLEAAVVDLVRTADAVDSAFVPPV